MGAIDDHEVLLFEISLKYFSKERLLKLVRKRIMDMIAGIYL
jgi:hypothetical protein